MGSKTAGAGDFCRRTVRIRNELGLHARPASLLVRTASSFVADVFLIKNGQEVNGKSIMGVMMLAAGQGEKLTVKACGDDAERAVEAIVSLIESGFDE